MSLAQDLRREAALRPGPNSSAGAGIGYLFGEVGLRIVMIYRVTMLLQGQGIKMIPTLLSRYLTRHYGIEIERGAVLGYGIEIPHPVGVVIGAGSVIEERAMIGAGVILGQRQSGGRPDGYPRIGRYVNLGAGSKVLGPVSVGESTSVGANSVVTRDLPAWSVAAGAPAVVIRPKPH